MQRKFRPNLIAGILWGAMLILGAGELRAQEPPTAEEPCQAAPPSRLTVGGGAMVQENRGTPLNMRDEASTYGSLIAQIPGRTQVEVLDGPLCGRANNLFAWWQIRTPDGLEGWVAEGDAQRSGDQYFLLPLSDSPVQPTGNDCAAAVESGLSVGAVAVVQEGAGASVNLRDAPAGTLISTLNFGDTLRVVGGPECGTQRQFQWWEVTTAAGDMGWVAEGDGTQNPPLYFLRPADDAALAELLREPQQPDCLAAPPTILQPDDVVRVAEDIGDFALNLREQPDGTALETLEADAEMTILDGPQCGNFFAYWQVRLADGREGWVAEGDATQSPVRRFIQLAAPADADALRAEIQESGADLANAAALEDPTACLDAPPSQVRVGGNVQILRDVTLRADPTLLSGEIRVLDSGTLARLMQGPRCGLGDDRLVWWQAMLPDGAMGWLPEGEIDEAHPVYYIEPFE
ncbi:MAG: SH3 domain-containing protein [Anaerolineales bacterium]